ncbi:MAG: hypothetical protein C0592_12430 [Marinilabiliales bacterium]|nr:MAG: hypothetical protein C0592_12430 [Marinilabiliales bacterium]
MQNDFTIRPATLNDSDFLVKAILMADRGPSPVSSYSGVFNLSEEEAASKIKLMLEEELDSCELSPEHFLVAEKDGQIAAAVAGWVEGFDGVASWMVRSALFQEYYPKEALENAQKLKPVVDEVVVHRTMGALQLESVFVDPAFRGNRLATKLFSAHVENCKKEHPKTEFAELMTYLENKKAIALYQKLGFDVIKQSKSKNPNVLNYYPGSGMVLMQIKLEKLLTT